MRQQLAGNALTAMCRVDGDIQNLHITVHDHTAGKAQQLAVVVCHPPTTRRSDVLAQFGQEHARRPCLVSGTFKAGSLQRACALGIRRAHGTELQMTTGELIGNTRNFALRTLGKTKTLALVFLGIRKARVNRQDAGRIAVTRSVREQQALARRPPQVALHAAGGLVLTQQLAIAHETVTGQLNLAPVRCLAPLIERHGGLDHVFALKLTLGTLIDQHIQRRIYLTAHSIGQDTKLAAHASLPRRPSASVERRHAQQRNIGTTREALGSGDADAHTRKGPRAAADHIATNIAAIQTGLSQHAINGIHELNVGVTATHVVATHELRLTRLPINPACRAGKHVSRGIERHHQRVVVMQAHLVQPYQSNGKAPLRGHRAPQALSFAHRCRPHHA